MKMIMLAAACLMLLAAPGAAPGARAAARAWGAPHGPAGPSSPAAATLGVAQCQPNCGTGKFRKYSATVVLYRVRAHDGVAYYSRPRVQYRHDGPRISTFRWARYPGATLPVWVGGPSSAGRPPYHGSGTS